MTVRYEGAGAANVRVTIADAGQEIGVDTVPAGRVALVFNYDEVFYVQGTLAELRDLHDRIYNLLYPELPERGEL
jgi:hypothetical protein